MYDNSWSYNRLYIISQGIIKYSAHTHNDRRKGNKKNLTKCNLQSKYSSGGGGGGSR